MGLISLFIIESLLIFSLFIYEMKIGFKLEWNILMELKLSFLNNESFCYLSSAILEDDSFKWIDVSICLFEDILFLSSFIILRFWVINSEATCSSFYCELVILSC
jgi:hypothetical protein